MATLSESVGTRERLTVHNQILAVVDRAGESLRQSSAAVAGLYGAPPGSLVLLVDPAGTILSMQPTERGWTGSPLAAHGLDLTDGPLREDVSIDGTGFLVAHGPMLASAASVYVAVPMVAAYERVNGVEGQLVIGAAVVFFVALLAIGVTANRLLVAPMDALVATARRLSPGRAPTEGEEDEFGTLTTALQSLAAARSAEAAPFRAAITAAEEGVLVAQAGGRITYANAAAGRALSARQDQLVGAGLHAVLHGAESTHIESACPLLAPLRDGQVRRGQAEEWLRGHHHRVPVSWSAIPLEDGASPGRVVVVFEDRTWRNRIEEGLRRSARMEAVGQLAGGIAHDFNNLLTAILGYGDLLHHRLRSNPGATPDNGAAIFEVEELLRAGHRAAALTRQLLTVSRPRQGTGEVADLNEMVREMERLLRRICGARIDLHIDLDPALEAMRADPTGVEQVLLNLVVNARDALPHGGALTIRTSGSRAADGTARVWLAVADAGIGMSPEVVEQIFEPFFTTKSEGTGIGLATVARIVRDADGEIHVDSEPGRGTTFRVGWPAFRSNEMATPRLPDVAALPCGQGTLLLVADDDTLRGLAHRTLTLCGYTVIDARDEANAVEVMEGVGGSVDLLVVDDTLPGVSGAALHARLRRRAPALRVLYLTNDGDPVAPGVPSLARPFTSHALATAAAALTAGESPTRQR